MNYYQGNFDTVLRKWSNIRHNFLFQIILFLFQMILLMQSRFAKGERTYLDKRNVSKLRLRAENVVVY